MPYVSNALFRTGNNPLLNACVGVNGGPYDFDDYALGYFRAGGRLVRSLWPDNHGIDTLVYPIVFNYRHAVELGLKFLASVLPGLVGGHAEVSFTHKLLDNWHQVTPLLRRDARFDPDGTRIGLVDRVLADFVQVDPYGEVFRFPVDKAGDYQIQSFEHVNVAVLGAAMDGVQEAFEGWFHAVHTYHD